MSAVRIDKAVILAAGRGTRMRRESPGTPLDEAQRQMAERGLKGLVPFHGHPFLSYGMSALADAGFREVCLVVGPETLTIREAYAALQTERLRISFAVQEEPLGSAHALLSAEAFAGDDEFLVLNSDNYYPVSVLQAMQDLPGSGLAGYRKESLLSWGNIPAERIAAYALVTTDARGCLDEIVEKPTPEEARRLEGHSWVSMTCWRFGPRIFEACRSIEPSARGELELPDAVGLAAKRMGECFQVAPVEAGALDLSHREDIPAVGTYLDGVPVRL